MVHMDPSTVAPSYCVSLYCSVLDLRVPEIDTETDRVVDRIGGGNAFQRTEAILYDIVTNDRTIAVIEGDACAIVQDGSRIGHYVLLAKDVVLDADTDVPDIVQPVTSY